MLPGYEFEQKVRQSLQAHTTLYAPLEVTSYKPSTGITLKLQDKEASFITEVSSRTAPKLVQQAIWQLKTHTRHGQEALLILPYLSKSVVQMCTEGRVSCIDLNGNYLIQTKKFLAIRLDRSNSYKESQPIKKIFSGNSSIVGRLLLRKRKIFLSLTEVYKNIIDLGGQLSQSAISKVLKSLEEELIIDKSSRRIVILQPEKLLDCLKTEYTPPKITEIQKLKVPLPVISFLRSSLKNSKWAITGESSTKKYTATMSNNIISAYVTDFQKWDHFIDERFYNLYLKKTVDSFVYFDVSKERKNWSSKIQCYLELSQLDKREREIGENLKEDILREFK